MGIKHVLIVNEAEGTIALTRIELDYMIAVTKGDPHECKRGTQTSTHNTSMLILVIIDIQWPRRSRRLMQAGVREGADLLRLLRKPPRRQHRWPASGRPPFLLHRQPTGHGFHESLRNLQLEEGPANPSGRQTGDMAMPVGGYVPAEWPISPPKRLLC
jgi:hypothetical protein